MNVGTDTLGDWKDEEPPTLSVTFHHSAWPLVWSSCSEVADFVSRYAGLIVADEAAAPESRVAVQQQAEHAINYILNELVENGYKFSSGGDIDIRIAVSREEMTVRVRNRIPTADVEKARASFERLLSEDTEELFLQRVTENAADEDSSASGLGFLTIMNDYGARLAWGFSPCDEPGYTWLTTMTRFTVDGVGQHGD